MVSDPAHAIVPYKPITYEDWLEQSGIEEVDEECPECEGGKKKRHEVECADCGKTHLCFRRCDECDGKGIIALSWQLYSRQLKLDRAKWEAFQRQQGQRAEVA